MTQSKQSFCIFVCCCVRVVSWPFRPFIPGTACPNSPNHHRHNIDTCTIQSSSAYFSGGQAMEWAALSDQLDTYFEEVCDL